MNEQKFYAFLQKQILLLVSWSLLTGFGYTVLCIMYDVAKAAIIWYEFIIIVSIWGWRLYMQFDKKHINSNHLQRWHKHVRIFTYIMFGLWTVLFILYSNVTQNNLYLVTIFMQIGASVIAATFLFSDKKLFVPILLILIYPLIIYFMSIEEAYGYFLSLYAIVFLGLLLYSSNSNNQLIEHICYQAQHDSLTGLFNRRYFTDYLEIMINSFKSSKKFAYILLIDLDHFKTINDSLGHDIGDTLLIEVSNRIKKYCADTHLVARIGGDEFMLASKEFKELGKCKQEAQVYSRKLVQILKKSYIIDYNHLHISASIGIKIIDKRTTKTSQAIKDADIAMYEVKAQGRDGVVNFNDILAKQVNNNLEMERKLYFALKNNEIELYYQAQVNHEEKIIGCEVLVRWDNPELGSISAIEFIAIAEKTGIIIDLGNYILKESFKTLQKWEDKGIKLEQFSINISVRQLLNDSFVFYIEHLCKKYLKNNITKKLMFEITETILAEDINKIVNIIKRLKKLGIRFSMDDFGTGYSSLNSLRELPIDELKIDRAFIRRLGEKPSDEMMVSTILSLAEILNLAVVAEGVETAEQFRFLLEHHCNIYQGYYFAKPMREEKFELHMLRNKICKIDTACNTQEESNHAYLPYIKHIV